MRVGIFGRGRLGSAVAALVAAEPGMELVFCIGREGRPEGRVDVALDASVASAVPGHLEWARREAVDLVIGATGWNREVLALPAGVAIGENADIGILTAANFSLAVAFMRRAALALGRFAALDADADLAVVERHHKLKADAPSGTAKLLAEALVEGSGRYSGWTEEPRAIGKLSIASLRAGSEVGYHELRLEAAAETIVLSHEAKSREIFARGALRSLSWIRGRKGVFSFDQMAAEIIEPLFALSAPPGVST